MKYVLAILAILLIAGCASQSGVSKEEFDALKAKVASFESEKAASVDVQPQPAISDRTDDISKDVNDLMKYQSLVSRSGNIDYNITLLENEILISQFTATIDSINADAIRKMCEKEMPRAAIVMKKTEDLLDEFMRKESKDILIRIEGTDFAESKYERYIKNLNGSVTAIRSVYNSGKSMCNPGVSVIDKRYDAIKIRSRNDATVKTTDIKIVIDGKDIVCSWDVPTVGYYMTASCSLPLNGKCVSGQQFKVVMPTGEEDKGNC